jgi:hypothetical protein
VQFSLFGADAAEPVRADLDGLMFGRALWVRNDDQARLSVLVAAGWRGAALVVSSDGVTCPATSSTPRAACAPSARRSVPIS